MPNKVKYRGFEITFYQAPSDVKRDRDPGLVALEQEICLPSDRGEANVEGGDWYYDLSDDLCDIGPFISEQAAWTSAKRTIDHFREVRMRLASHTMLASAAYDAGFRRARAGRPRCVLTKSSKGPNK